MSKSVGWSDYWKPYDELRYDYFKALHNRCDPRMPCYRFIWAITQSSELHPIVRPDLYENWQAEYASKGKRRYKTVSRKGLVQTEKGRM